MRSPLNVGVEIFGICCWTRHKGTETAITYHTMSEKTTPFVHLRMDDTTRRVDYVWKWNSKKQHFDLWVGELAIGKPGNAMKSVADILEGVRSMFLVHFATTPSVVIEDANGTATLDSNPTWDLVKKQLALSLSRCLVS